MRQLSSLLRHHRSGSPSTCSARRCRPRLEGLESRLAPSTITVTSTADSGAGTLRDAVAGAVNGDTIVFSLPSPSTIDLTGGSISVGPNISINGPGADKLTVIGGFGLFGNVSLSGMTISAPGQQALQISGFQETITACTITGSSMGILVNDFAFQPNVVLNNCLVSNNANVSAPDEFGGGIYNKGNVQIDNSTIVGNTTGNANAMNSGGAGIFNSSAASMVINDSVIKDNVAGPCAGNVDGGAIWNQGAMSIFDSSIIGNSATGAVTDQFGSGGGGIFNENLLVMDGCTIAGNNATGGVMHFGSGGVGQGGGLFLVGLGSTTLTNCTITGNLAEGGTSSSGAGGGIYTADAANIQFLSCTIARNSAAGPAGSTGGGLFANSAVTMNNTIVAANSAGVAPDADGSGTFNGCLIGDADSLTITSGTADELGTGASLLNPDLGPLANYGGRTKTLALLPGSPAIDHGDNIYVTERYDQRGYARIVNNTVDVGAYEFQPIHLLAVGAGYGMAPEVKVYDPTTGQLRLDFLAYESTFRGGVRVAVADMNGDGIPDIITAPGGVKVSLVNVNGALVPSFDLSAGRAPEVKVFSGADGSLLDDFLAYDPLFKAGLFVAAANTSGSPGHADIIVSPDATGQSGHANVRLFFNKFLIKTGASLSPQREFNAYASGFGGGVRIATADLNGDGIPDIITAPGIWSGPDVRVFDGASLYNGLTPHMIGEFLAYAAGYFGGVFVAAGDVNGDGVADIITGTNGFGGPEVKAFSGLTLLNHPSPTVLDDFYAYSPLFGGGSTVAALDINGDGHADIITGAGPGGGPHVRIFDGATELQLQQNTTDSFMAFDLNFSGGVFIGAG